MSAFLSAGLQYQVSPVFNLRVAPIFRHQLISFEKSPRAGFLWNAGLNLGLYYNLKYFKHFLAGIVARQLFNIQARHLLPGFFVAVEAALARRKN